MMRILRAENYREGRWPNGLGLSWDIAAAPRDAGAQEFEWRIALAQIDSSVAFSHYPNVDRIFTLINGHGLELVFNDHEILKIDKRFVPHEFPGDVKTACVVNNGPCRALNLFTRRGAWEASVRVLNTDDDLKHHFRPNHPRLRAAGFLQAFCRCHAQLRRCLASFARRQCGTQTAKRRRACSIWQPSCPRARNHARPPRPGWP